MPTLTQLLHAPHCRGPWRALLVLLLGVVSVAALAPGGDAPSLGVGDKVDHLLAFVALAVAAVLSGHAARRPVARVAAGLLAYGALIEVAQTRVPGRQGDLIDLAIDAAGILLGLAAAQALRSRWPASNL